MVSPSTNSLGSRGALRLLRRSRPLDSHHDNFDRFIPNRSAMDFDYASYMLTQGQGQGQARNEDNAYQQGLAQVFNMNRPRILAFRNLTPTRRGTAAAAAQSIFPQPNQAKLPPPPAKPRPVCHTWDRKLDAPDILHDYGLNILDWGRTNNVLAIALANTVYLWNAAKKSTFELVTVSNDQGPVTSLCWAPDGCRLAVGLNDSMVQLWDTAASSPTRTIQGTHTSRVASLAWNHHVLTTGGMDGLVVNHDTRISDDVIQRYRGHTQQVCGLKWSPSGTKLASGGNDNLVHIWDRSSNSPTRWLHRLRQHTDAVKALAWCPFQSNLLATGGGEGDHSIKFWNSQTGACLNSINTASQVSGLLWNRNQRELLSSHGCDLTLWKYPSLAKLAHLTGHTSSILHMTESPDGCTVATAAGDETLMFWNVFGTPALAAKRASKSKPEPFAHVSRIR